MLLLELRPAALARSARTAKTPECHWTAADPEQMLGALRAGSIEFVSLPMNPAIFGALDRIGTRLTSSRPDQSAQGRIIGLVSSKGGCGATTLACHLGLALALGAPDRR